MNNQNNFANPNPYGYPAQPQPFVQYGAQPQAPKMTQVLTPEQQNRLRNKGFDLRLTDEDILRAVCTHKSNGNIVLIDLGNGRMKCPICGEEFNLCEVDSDAVKQATDLILDFLQSTKTMYLNIPEETVSNYFQIIPLLKKLPDLYKMAVDDFNKFFGNTGSAYGMQRNNGFAMLNNMFSPMAATGGYYQQPMMQPQAPGMAPGYQQPMMQPQQYNPQMMNPAMGMQPPAMAAPMMGGNPFGYNGPAVNQMGYQAPMMQPQVPTAPQQAPAETKPQNGKEVVQQKTMNV